MRPGWGLNPGSWARNALLHMAIECFDHWATYGRSSAVLTPWQFLVVKNAYFHDCTYFCHLLSARCMHVSFTCNVEQGRIHGLKSGGRIMASARNEAPRGVRCGEGCPLSTGGGGYAPVPDFLFVSSKWQVLCILGAIFIAVELSDFHA